MSDTFAIQHVLNGLRGDIARRTTLIRDHHEAAAQLEADNVADARHAEVAAALIEQINADALAAAWAPTNEVAAAALVADNAAIDSLPRSDKAAAHAQLLVMLHGADGLAAVAANRVHFGGLPRSGKTSSAVADIAAVDGEQSARLVHDHHPDAGPCPACLLTGAGDLAALDGIDTGAEVAR